MRPIDADAIIQAVCTKLGIKDKKFLLQSEKAIVDVILNAPTIEVPKWIPCSERLPNNFNEDETVLATTDVDGDRVITMFAVDVKTFYLKGYVSAWMPLPKPYEEGDHE